MSESHEIKRAVECLECGGMIELVTRDSVSADRYYGRSFRKVVSVVGGPPPNFGLDKSPSTFQYDVTDEQAIELLADERVEDSRLTAEAMKLLVRIEIGGLGHVAATPEAQELHDTRCTVGTFSTAPGPTGKTIYVVEAVTPLGKATVAAAERRRNSLDE